MLNFTGVSRKSTLGRMVRLPLKLIPRDLVLPVIQGPMRGMKWVTGSDVHGCWLGSYEPENQAIFRKMVRPGNVIYDLGAHVGFYSLLASRLVGDAGKVFAFEPVPCNVGYIRRHVDLNDINNIQIFESAVTSHSGRAQFELGRISQIGKLSDAGGMSVEVVSIDDLVLKGLPVPDLVKMDIEGAEFEGLLGMTGTLKEHHPTIILSCHSAELTALCAGWLAGLGYRITAIDGKPIAQSLELLAI